MPNKSVELILQRLSLVEQQLSNLYEKTEHHLEEGSGVKADLAWLKKALWAMAGGCVTFGISLVLYVLTHTLR